MWKTPGLCFSHCLKCLSLLHLPLMDEQLGKRNSMNNHCLVVLSDGSGVTCRSIPSLRQSFSSHPNCGRDEQLSETGPNSSGMFPCHRPGPGHSRIHSSLTEAAVVKGVFCFYLCMLQMSFTCFRCTKLQNLRRCV